MPTVANDGDNLFFKLAKASIVVTTSDLHPQVTGSSMTVTAVRLCSAAMEAEFANQLPTQAQRFLFIGGVQKLPPATIKAARDGTGRHSMAFIATLENDGLATEIGASFYGAMLSDGLRQMTVAVSDRSDDQDVAALLSKQMIEFARGHGLKQLYSVDLADNSQMGELAAKLGMHGQSDPEDARLIIYSMAL